MSRSTSCLHRPHTATSYLPCHVYRCRQRTCIIHFFSFPPHYAFAQLLNNRNLSCRRETARCFLLFNISQSLNFTQAHLKPYTTFYRLETLIGENHNVDACRGDRDGRPHAGAHKERQSRKTCTDLLINVFSQLRIRLLSRNIFSKLHTFHAFTTT